MFVACANGQQLKCLTVINEHTREALAIDVAGSIRSQRLIDVLSKLVSERGAPTASRSDDGREPLLTRLLQRAGDQGRLIALSQSGERLHVCTDESFNGKFRDECLSMEYSRSRLEARGVIEQWWRHYNQVRPHSALGHLTLPQFVRNHSGDNHEVLLLT